jgi:exonuclease SbcC
MIIKAKDYEIIENLTLELKEGITVIVGASNNGKSSIIRLLRSLFYNLNNDSSIRQGETSYTIGVVDNNNKVIVKRDLTSANKTVYSVNGNVLKKVGRNPVPEVEDVLNIRIIDINKKKMELNFLRQMEFPFLLGESGGFIYDFLSSSSNQNDFTDLFKTMKHDLKEISDNKKRLEGQVDTLKDMYQTSKDIYDKLEPIDPLIEEILAFDIKMKHLQKLSDSIVNLEYADEGIINQNKVLKEYTGKYELLKDIDNLAMEYDKYKELEKQCIKIEELNSKIQLQQESIARLDKLNKMLNMQELENLMNNVEALGKQVTSLDHRIIDIQRHHYDIDKVEEIKASNARELDMISVLLELITNKTNMQEFTSKLDKHINNMQELVQQLEGESLNINRYNVTLKNITKEMDNFEICPLCNKPLK